MLLPSKPTPMAINPVRGNALITAQWCIAHPPVSARYRRGGSPQWRERLSRRTVWGFRLIEPGDEIYIHDSG